MVGCECSMLYSKAHVDRERRLGRGETRKDKEMSMMAGNTCSETSGSHGRTQSRVIATHENLGGVRETSIAKRTGREMYDIGRIRRPRSIVLPPCHQTRERKRAQQSLGSLPCPRCTCRDTSRVRKQAASNRDECTPLDRQPQPPCTDQPKCGPTSVRPSIHPPRHPRHISTLNVSMPQRCQVKSLPHTRGGQ